MGMKHYNVTGMTCEHCAKAVTEELEAIPGLEVLGVDVEKGEVTVSGENISDAAVSDAVEEAGYQVVE